MFDHEVFHNFCYRIESVEYYHCYRLDVCNSSMTNISVDRDKHIQNLKSKKVRSSFYECINKLRMMMRVEKEKKQVILYDLVLVLLRAINMLYVSH